MKLSPEEITKLATKKGVKTIAVENFLGSLGDSTRNDAIGNLNADARSYKWNAATVAAIRAGILRATS